MKDYYQQIIEYRCKAETYLRRKKLKYKYIFDDSSKYRISHVTYYASNNVGDTVLSDTVRKGFEHFIEEPISWRLYNVSDIVTSNDLERFNESLAVLIGGGGLFLPDTNKNSLSGWQWPYTPEQLASIAKPIILFAIGYNYFRDQEPNALFVKSLTDIVSKSDFIGLRNRGSIKAVQELLPEELGKKIVFQPCLTTLISRIGYSLPSKEKSKNIAINIAYDRIESRLGINKDSILSSIASAIKEIEIKGYNIFYIAHISKDLGFVNYLKEKDIKVKVICASSWSAQKLISFYNSMDVVIGMRGHAQMIPFGVDTQIITLGSHNKMKWFLEDIEAEDWYIELKDNPDNLKEQIVEKFVNIYEKNYNDTNERIFKAKNSFYDNTKQNFEIINNIMFQ